MADNDQVGWKIGTRFYEHVGADALRHGDFALIREVTGMTLDQFDRGDDPVATETGWLAVAVWRGNPDLRREQVVRMVEQLGHDDAERVGWSTPEKQEDDAVPPPVADAATGPGSPSPKPDSGSSSKTSADSPQDGTPAPSTPASSGRPDSVIGSPA
jgi:hypothetical protein